MSPQVNAGRVDPRLLSTAWQVPHEAGTPTEWQVFRVLEHLMSGLGRLGGFRK